MAADGIHGHTEKKLRQKGDVYDFEDLKDVINESTKRLEVLDISSREHFVSIPSININQTTRTQKCSGSNFPYLDMTEEVKFERGTCGFLYKNSFIEEYKICSFVKKSVELSGELLSTPLPNCPRGISSIKKKILLKS